MSVSLLVLVGLAATGPVSAASPTLGAARVEHVLRATGLDVLPDRGLLPVGAVVEYSFVRQGRPVASASVLVYVDADHARRAAIADRSNRAVDAAFCFECRTARVQNVLLAYRPETSRAVRRLLVAALSRLGRPVTP